MTSNFLMPITLLASKILTSGFSSFLSRFLPPPAPNISVSQDSASPSPPSTCSLGQLLFAHSFKCHLISGLSNSNPRFPQTQIPIPFTRHLLYAESFAKHISVSFNLHDNPEKKILGPILQMGDRRLRAVRGLAQGCSANWSQIQDSNPKVYNFSPALVLPTKSTET